MTGTGTVGRREWMHPPWWLAYPEIWAEEQESLRAAGARWSDVVQTGKVPPEEMSFGSGPSRRLIVVLWPDTSLAPNARPLELLVRYPATYPWAPPAIRLIRPEQHPPRHTAFDGTLCLIGDDSWTPGTTVASVLAQQLPAVFRPGDYQNGHAPREIGAEPVWLRIRTSVGAILAEPESLPPATVCGGVADVAPLRTVGASVVLLVWTGDYDRHSLWRSQGPRLGVGDVRTIPWARISDIPERGELLAVDLWERVGELLRGTGAEAACAASERLVLLPTEIAQGARSETWLLLEEPGERAVEINVRNPAEPPRPTTILAHRGFAVGRGITSQRVREAASQSVAAASVAVVGTGAVGGQIAEQLVRAGIGHLRVVDPDQVDPATTCRQITVTRDAGSPKILAVATRLWEIDGTLDLTASMVAIGDRDGTEMRDLARCDVVVDATANAVVTRYLAAHLREVAVPLVVASATAGGWGGLVSTLPAAGGGCWECAQRHRADHSVPWPPAREEDEVVPVGCAKPTFTGMAADLWHVSLQAARTVIQGLRDADAGRVGGWSRYGDLQVLALHDEGGPCQPRWTSAVLSVHPECGAHAARHRVATAV